MKEVTPSYPQETLPTSPSGSGAQEDSSTEQSGATISDQLNRDMHELFVQQGIIFFQDRALRRLNKSLD